MASKPAIISQKDVTRIVKGYAAAGIAVEMTVENGVARFAPVDQTANDAKPSSLAAWREARNAGKVVGRA